MKKIMLILVAIAGMAVNASAQEVEGQSCPIRENGKYVGQGRYIGTITSSSTATGNSYSASGSTNSSGNVSASGVGASSSSGYSGSINQSNQTTTNKSYECVSDEEYNMMTQDRAKRDIERNGLRGQQSY